jgi:hypothetical protein
MIRLCLHSIPCFQTYESMNVIGIYIRNAAYGIVLFSQKAHY